MKFYRKTVEMTNGCIALAGVRMAHRDVPITDKRQQLCYGGDRWVASRLSYHFNISPIPRRPVSLDELILHTCDNEWCVNPDHLYMGTASQNMSDMHARHPTTSKDRGKSLSKTRKTQYWKSKWKS